MESVLRLSQIDGINLLFRVHDELVYEADENIDVKLIEDAMSAPISWAPGLPLGAAGFETKYYMKD